MNKTNQKKVILQVVPALEQGGVETGTVQMAKYIQQQGYKSLVTSAGGGLVSGLIKNNINHFTLPLNRRDPFSILYCAFRIVQIIRENGVDLVHARSRAPAWAAYIATSITKTPFVTSMHGTHKIQNFIKKFYNSVMTKGILIIANSNYIQKHLIEKYSVNPKKITVAPRGIDEHTFNPGNVNLHDVEAEREALHLKKDVPIILMPGRLTRWKGHEVFLKALEEVADLNWQAVVVGGAKNAAYEKELKALSKKYGIENKVYFVGSKRNIPLYYYMAYVSVSASLEPEAFGRIAIESQALGTPVIATAHGGSLETVKDGETGFLVEPNNAESMAKILRSILTDPQKRNMMGDNARRMVHNTFTAQRMCSAEFGVYKKILGS